jgi:hypothetical protein
MRLVHAAQKERDLFGGEVAIVIEVNDIESFSDLVVRKQLAMDVIASGLSVEWVFGYYLFVVVFCVITQQNRFHIELPLRSIDFYCVLIFEFFIAFA